MMKWLTREMRMNMSQRVTPQTTNMTSSASEVPTQIKCEKCKELLSIKLDIKHKARTCEKGKCPCKREKFLKNIANIAQCSVDDFKYVATGQLKIHEPEPIKNNVQHQGPWQHHGSRHGEYCAYAPDVLCAVQNKCCHDYEYCG